MRSILYLDTSILDAHYFAPANHNMASVAWAAALRVDDNIMSAAADCFADQAVIVAGAVAGRCVEKIDSEIERAANGGD
jgi:hypothetical protein